MGSVQCTRVRAGPTQATTVENEELLEFGDRKVACEATAGQAEIFETHGAGVWEIESPPLSSTPSYACPQARVKGLI